jgi:cytochrome P450
MVQTQDWAPVRNDIRFEEAPMAHDRRAGAAYFGDAGPVFQDANGVYYVTTSEGEQYVLQNPKLFSSAKAYDSYFKVEAIGPTIPNAVDPPAHVRYRRALDPLFSPRVLNPLEDDLRRQAAELVDAFADKGACNVMTDLAELFPTRVFLTLFGLPLSDREKYWDWARTINQNASFSDGVGAEALRHASGELTESLREFIAAKRAAPGEDILSRIITIEGDDAWSDREILGFAFLFTVAGLDTVAASMGFVMHYLATNPDVRRSIIDDPELVSPVIEEIMRLEPVAPMIPRVTTQEVTVSGYRIPADSTVLVCSASANRDVARFPHPDSLDVGRDDAAHFGFGGGIHRCVGSHLARRELRIMVEEFHKRIPDYELAPGAVSTVRWPAGAMSLDEVSLVFPAPAPTGA